MGWKRKWAKDSIKALLPFQAALRRLKRRWFPYTTEPANDEYMFRQGLQQVGLLRKAAAQLANASVLELGSGWHPIIPLLFHVAGCRPVTLTDQETLMDSQTLVSAVRFLRHRAAGIAEAFDMEIGDVRAQLSEREGAALEDLLAAYDLRYVVPYKPEETPSASIAVITSRAVLEHISRGEIERLFSQFRRILKADGLMCHIVDNSDHWEHGDKSISKVNFLRYPEGLLPILGLNRQNYQNRLRHFEYAALLRASGFEVLTDIGEVDGEALRELGTLRLSRRYRNMDHRDLAIMTSCLVARPRVSGNGM